MKKFLCLLVVLAVSCSLSSALALNESVKGASMPDFTVATTEGENFSLSRAVEEKGVVLINFFATWCPPCKTEFPALNTAYERYRDRVAVIALSVEPTDSLEVLRAYQAENGLTIPMAQDEDNLILHVGYDGVPTSVIVDRFGNIAYLEVGAMFSPGSFERLFDYFLSDSYTNTTVLSSLPAPLVAPVYPAAESWAIRADNGSPIAITLNGEEYSPAAWCDGVYIVEDDRVLLSLDVPGQVDLDLGMLYTFTNEYVPLSTVIKEDGTGFAYAMPVADSSLGYEYALLYGDDGYAAYGVIILHTETEADQLMDYLSDDAHDFQWRYLNPPEDALAVYTVTVVDQEGAPVPGAIINFCTDTMCQPCVADENGVLTFTGEPLSYHLQFLTVPGGYSFDPSFEIYTEARSSRLTVTVTKE